MQELSCICWVSFARCRFACSGERRRPCFEDGDVELQDTVRPDPEGSVGILIGDLEMVSQILLTSEFADFDRCLVIDRVFGEGPFGECRREGIGHRQRQDAVSNALAVAAHRHLAPLFKPGYISTLSN